MFIVIEGLDGAGKSTQVAKIKQFLESRSLEYEYLHFPRFTTPYYGELTSRFLRGELGALDQVHPQLVAMMYAGDRLEAAPMIREWIAQGRVVIVDRYVLSNVAYQCAKIKDPVQKDELKQWILGLEYELNRIPQADLTLFLDVPFQFTRDKLSQNRQGDDRDYLCGKEDIHEASLELQRAVREMYLDHAQSNYKIIDCSTRDGEMLDPELISHKIIDEISKLSI